MAGSKIYFETVFLYGGSQMSSVKSLCEHSNKQGFRNYLAYPYTAKSYYASQPARIRRIIDTCRMVQISNSNGVLIEISYFTPYLYVVVWNKQIYFENFTNICLILKNAYLRGYNIRVA